ncbi:hypothetical protein Tco_0126785 [Tanacetum coccineum]
MNYSKHKRGKGYPLKAKKESSDYETLISDSDDEEYAMAVRDFKKLFRLKARFVRQPLDKNKSFRKRDEKKGKINQKCRRCGDPNHLIGEFPQPLRNKDQKALVEVLGVIVKMKTRKRLMKKLVSWLNRQMRSPSSKGCLRFNKNEASTSGTKQVKFVKSAGVLADNRSTIREDESFTQGSDPVNTSLHTIDHEIRTRNEKERLSCLERETRERVEREKRKDISVVRQPTAFKSERPRFSKQRFASQVDVNNDLSKPVTTHYLPKEREYVVAKPHHMIAPGSSRYSSNDMVHNHYLEEAKKKTQESSRNSEPSVMPSARSQSIANDSKPKPRINRTSRHAARASGL